MELRFYKQKPWVWFSPWMIIGSVCILAAILIFLASKNIHREKVFMERALLSEANILVDSLEASSRTGMMGMGWGQRQVQVLMEETAQQPDVLYVAIVNSAGQVIADSRADRVGSILPFVAPQPGQILQRYIRGREKSFEVIRAYSPWYRQKKRGQGNMSCRLAPGAPVNDNMFAIVGLDPSPFEAALRQDMQQTYVLFLVMFLAGAAGIISLVWMQNYRSARGSLHEMERFTSTLAGQLPVGLLVTDKAGDIQRVNQAAQQILHSSAITGRIDQFPCFLRMAKRLESEGAILEEEVEYSANDSRSTPLLVNAAIIRDEERQTSGHVFLFSDLTRLKQLEDQLRRSERLAALGQLAAGVAHEIRNPLSSIKGFAIILATRCKEDERSSGLAAVMEKEVDRLDRVITDLLEFSRPTELNKETFSCRELIRHSLQLVEKQAGDQGVSIQWQIDPEDLQVELDADRFAQVLLNLYLNALQAMETGGALKINSFMRSNEVIFQISDSGTGIAAEHLPHLFDPYFTTKPRGVGLGLANVHKLVEAHRGTIEVESLAGQGTTFTVRLPLSEDPSSRTLSRFEQKGVNQHDGKETAAGAGRG
ncbi:ATP-binding protein [Desulfoferrobacter suflitae]|uniref:ATP-binding protein n=1 Tax=Desulfoferrobacter suflitae TaxID=2865782 RepID=UPI0021643B64|nr:ATP-binding protein [Desulfoferrobacter suflitae]MCK8604204.1 ATP-binding protein [Desulfoferrobacter suflitae]MDD3815875.1 ATP-binding protein [Desulfocapsaceae bacterium]